MSKSGGGSGIGQIVSGHIDSLDRGNGTLLGGSDTFLESTHISSKSGLVTDSRRNTTQQGRHLRTSLGESENVVDKKQHILTFVVTEVLSDSQTGQGDTRTGTRGLVHLTVHEGDLRVLQVFHVNDTSLFHFVVQIISFTSSLTDTSKNRETTVSFRNIVDQFHNQDSFSDTSTTKQTNLTSLSVRGQQVNNLNSSDQNFIRGSQLFEGRRISVDR
mmetsp:Transcript_32191/g.44139  ORF Transcript_32191/g.44139 Transcript_32191/m.44139 type:complete len:216 (+) Transcript_32191:922-1569(+)